jgi:COP9 signalosome complex subunit 3
VILAEPISSLYHDVSVNDNLIFHYTGGMILAALKRWKDAEEWFEICASAPAQVPSAVQMEAVKKLVIVQLIWRGKVRRLCFRSPSCFFNSFLGRRSRSRNTHTRRSCAS